MNNREYIGLALLIAFCVFSAFTLILGYRVVLDTQHNLQNQLSDNKREVLISRQANLKGRSIVLDEIRKACAN